MSKADLTRKATYASMFRLGGEVLERPGEEPTTSHVRFEGRNGYEADFLNGWTIGLPQVTGPNADDMQPLRRGGTGVELKYQNFSIIMSKSRRLPILTAVNLSGQQRKRIPRINTWSFDGRLNPEDQWGDDLYFQNSLDRGHMVRREDPVWGPQANQANIDTFHFTNSCPQMASVNQKTWLGLEDHILEHAKADGMKVNVYTGPFFRDDDPEYRGAKIPLDFWKVVAIVTEDGRPSATAYQVSQQQEIGQLEYVFGAYLTYQISILEVMDRTGIDFSALTDFDGFSQQTRATGSRVIERVSDLETVKI